ncbi:MAG: tyrosine-type recombinase/integrase, partial [Candidatus Peribacteraceae bacterium]|nr:tyrosine-type recombinase/integrase [Candidatus Peribacteraceae bacterium]
MKYTTQTYKEKKSVFRSFFRFVDHSLPAVELKSGQVLSFLQEQAKSRSGYAANKDRKNLVAAWNWGIKYLGLPALNPCLVDRFPEKRQVRYVPSEKDFWNVYDQADSEQDKLMLLSYLHLAARRSELFRLRWDDIDFSESKARLFTRKRKDSSLEYDWLPLTDDLYEALLAHRQNSNSQWVFIDPRTGLPYIYRQRMMKRL